jgi:hypothetical protein
MGKYLPKIVKTVILNLGLTINEFSNQTKIKLEDVHNLLDKNIQWEIANLQKFIDFCSENNQKNYSFDYLLTDNNGKLTEKDFDTDRFTIGQNGPSKLLFLKKINTFYHRFIDSYKLNESLKKPELIIYNKDHFRLLLDDPYIRDSFGKPIAEKPEFKNNYDSYLPDLDLEYKGDSLLYDLKSSLISDYSLEVNYDNVKFYIKLEKLLKRFANGDLSLLNPLKESKLFIDGKSFANNQKRNFYGRFDDIYPFNLHLLPSFGITELEIYSYWIDKIKEKDLKFSQLNNFLLYLISFFETPDINESNFINNEYWYVNPENDYKKMFYFLNKNYKLINLLLNAGAYIPLQEIDKSKQAKINFLKTEQLKDFIRKHL